MKPDIAVRTNALMDNNLNNFIQQNSPDGGFLQSEEWGRFQESFGRKVYNVASPLLPFGHPLPGREGGLFWANIIEHRLPVVGKYFYVPRGPVIENQKSKIKNDNEKIKNCLGLLINLAIKNNAGWIRIEPATEEILEMIKNHVGNAHARPGDRNAYMRSLQNLKITKALHDMQPRELLIIDITKSEEQLLSDMKQKTRYNIRLAERNDNLKIRISGSETRSRDAEEFIQLVKVTAKRDRITSHPESYYRKMFETIPGEILKLYVAEFEGRVVAANIVVFYGNTATYLHGASDNEHRNVMAPYLLQWEQIKDAKKSGYEKYDMGGVKTGISNFQFPISNKTPKLNDQNLKQKIPNTKYQILNTNWAGITRFKIGFSPGTESTSFPGCYDIIISPRKYWIYKVFSCVIGLKKRLGIS